MQAQNLSGRGIKRRPFFLMEILLSLSLISILLAVLFSFFVQSMRFESQLAKTRARLFQRQHVASRLNTLFSSLVSPPTFYTQEENLIFVFDNGIDPDPHFSGPLLGRIYCDSDRRLVLQTYPIEAVSIKSGAPYRKEILAHNVAEHKFTFFAAADWQPTWDKEDGARPAMIRLELDKERYAFHLPEPPIAFYP